MREFDEGERDTIDHGNDNDSPQRKNENTEHQNPNHESFEHHNVEKEST